MTDSSAKQDGSEGFRPLPQASAETPVFSLIVHVLPAEEGVEATAANLAGFSQRASNERSALQKLLSEVKQHVSSCVARGEVIEWVDPSPEPPPGGQNRVIPFHL